MRKLSALVAVAGAFTLVVAAGANATPPEHFPVEPAGDPVTIVGACAFPIVLEREGDVRPTLFFDRDGNASRGLTSYANSRVTFTNADTGKSVTTASSATEHVTFNPDGSFVVKSTGLVGHVIVGGGPPLAVDVGRIVLLYDGPEDDEPELLDHAGQLSGGPFPALCEALAGP